MKGLKRKRIIPDQRGSAVERAKPSAWTTIYSYNVCIQTAYWKYSIFI